jgi:hypothetical protein
MIEIVIMPRLGTGTNASPLTAAAPRAFPELHPVQLPPRASGSRGAIGIAAQHPFSGTLRDSGQPIDALCGAAEQHRLLGWRVSGREPFQCIPKDRVTRAGPARREVAPPNSPAVPLSNVRRDTDCRRTVFSVIVVPPKVSDSGTRGPDCRQNDKTIGSLESAGPRAPGMRDPRLLATDGGYAFWLSKPRPLSLARGRRRARR